MSIEEEQPDPDGLRPRELDSLDAESRAEKEKGQEREYEKVKEKEKEKEEPPGSVHVEIVPRALEDALEPGDESDDDDALAQFGTDDPFPVDPSAPEEQQQFTFRAVFVGCALGAVISASNVYLGLKTGWTFGASLFGSIFGFAILKAMATTLPARWGGGPFGPKENVCCQSAATAAGSLGLLFTSGFPAAYQLGLLGASPMADYGRLVTFTLGCAYVGIFFTMPLRRLYILQLKLPFPNAVAAAYTIRSLHVGRHAAARARRKTRALLAAFVLAVAWRVASEYAPGILWDWHWAWWLYCAGWKGVIAAENWGWIWEWTPAFIGVGLLVPLSSSLSFLGGAVLAWAIIGPALVASHAAVGSPAAPAVPAYINYANMLLDDPVHAPSPKYWMIWPGCAILLCASLAEIAANAPAVLRRLCARVRVPVDAARADPVPPRERTPWWLWAGGLAAGSALTLLVMARQFGQSAAVTLLALLVSFVFALVGAECAGRIAVTPVTTLGNFAQLVFGGVAKGTHAAPRANQLNNGLAGMLTLAVAEQAADMLGDLKTTHLLGASPRVQLYAQCVGALVSVFLSAGMYVVFSAAYPCINTLTTARCAFPAPDVGAWRAVSLAVSLAVSAPALPIPRSSGIAALAFGVLAAASTAAKYTVGTTPARRALFPNWNAVGIAFILGPLCTYPLAMAFGGAVGRVWGASARGARSWEMYGYALAAGMIAGEGVGGIVNAVLQIVGGSGAVWGSVVGCPAGVYCG